MWAKPHDADWLGPRWAEVDDYLQAVIEHVVRAGSYVTEGMVQATIGVSLRPLSTMSNS